MRIIARIHNAYDEKFGVPRQSGLANEVLSEIVFEKEYRVDAALRGIEDFSHLWPDGEGGMVAHRPAPKARREPVGGCVCHPFSFSAERNRAELRATGREGENRRRNGVESCRSRPDEWDPDL